VAQAKYLAIKKAFKTLPLDKLSWGIDWGCVREENSNEVFAWMVSEQIVPLDEKLKKLFSGKKYKKYIDEKIKEYRFVFDEEKYQNIKKTITVSSMEKIV
jgi:hypothetical protein